MNNPISVDYSFMFIYILYLIIILGIIGLAVYFVICTIRFFKQKTRNDSELLNKLDELIRLQMKQFDKED